MEKHASFCHIHGSVTVSLDICGQEYTQYIVQYALCFLFHSKPLECTGQTPSSVVIFIPSDFLDISYFWQFMYKWRQLQSITTSDFTLLTELVSSLTTVEETFFIYFGRKQWNTFQSSQRNLGETDRD